ncbi:MAG: ribonuclease HII [Anaerolineaceae bacterium]|nr:ribonuclease HII [Anaerolineaceae bacterium]MBN2677414.1 ribonuclease HII [Anaerolineaceae bacterium]
MKHLNIAPPDLSHEKALWKAGFRFIGGIDEAGRGAWAGPVFAAVVILADCEANMPLVGYIRDSKQMTPNQRTKWVKPIKDVCLDWGVAYASNVEIDSHGIVPATYLAVRRALRKLRKKPDYLILDYLTVSGISIPQESLVRGDQRVFSIAAASILAKTARDEYMIKMGRIYQAYSFPSNKGYGTDQHQRALLKSGICDIHRVSFKPIARIKNRPHADD